MKKQTRNVVLIICIIMLAALSAMTLSSCGRSAPGGGGITQGDGSSNSDNGSNNGGKKTVDSEQITEAYDFSDGVAWVAVGGDWAGGWLSGDWVSGTWLGVDKTGKILLELGDGDIPLSGFSQGVALVKRKNGTIELIRPSGKVISSPKTEEYDKIVSFVKEIGMIVVHKHINTFQETKDLYGIIDKNGDWYQELRENSTLYALAHDISHESGYGGQYVYGSEKTLTYNNSCADYIGNMVIKLRMITKISQYNDNLTQDFTYNLSTGSVTGAPRILGGTGDYITFEEGYGVSCHRNSNDKFPTRLDAYMEKGSIYLVKSTGELKEIVKGINAAETLYGSTIWGSCTLGSLGDGLFYFSDKMIDRTTGLNQGFYDTEGNLVIDLYEYDVEGIPVFRDGYCLLQLKNPQGTPYYTIIDRTGNQMFEPMSGSVNGQMRCGMLLIMYPTIINHLGEKVVIEDDDYYFASSSYVEDVLMIRKQIGNYKYNYRFMNKEGEMLF